MLRVRTKTTHAAPKEARKYVLEAPFENLSDLFRFLIYDTTEISATNMTKGKTVSTAGRTAPTSTSSKKRKLEGVQKYYAVQVGKEPGVYLTYAECQAQTAGFKGAICKEPPPPQNLDIAPVFGGRREEKPGLLITQCS